MFRRWGQVGDLQVQGQLVRVLARYRDDELGLIRYVRLADEVFLESEQDTTRPVLQTAELADFIADEQFRPLWNDCPSG